MIRDDDSDSDASLCSPDTAAEPPDLAQPDCQSAASATKQYQQAWPRNSNATAASRSSSMILAHRFRDALRTERSSFPSVKRKSRSCGLAAVANTFVANVASSKTV